MFLKNCGSGDILLKIVKVEHEEMPEAKNVVAVLEEFMKEAPAQSFWWRIWRWLCCEVMQAVVFKTGSFYNCHRIAISDYLKTHSRFFHFVFSRLSLIRCINLGHIFTVIDRWMLELWNFYIAGPISSSFRELLLNTFRGDFAASLRSLLQYLATFPPRKIIILLSQGTVVV